MHYCLSRDELKQLLNLIIQHNKSNNTYELSLVSIIDSEFRIRLDDSLNWQDELGALSYLFAQILESNIFASLTRADLIELFYELPNRLLITIQDFDEAFIDYMLYRNLDLSITSLEDCLIKIQNDLRNYRYDKAIRI